MMAWNDFEPERWMYYGPTFMIIMMGACMLMMFFMMRGHNGSSRGDSAGQILKERFARGEIDKAEFDDRKRTLEA
jgi:putative membrane protein